MRPYATLVRKDLLRSRLAAMLPDSVTEEAYYSAISTKRNNTFG